MLISLHTDFYISAHINTWLQFSFCFLLYKSWQELWRFWDFLLLARLQGTLPLLHNCWSLKNFAWETKDVIILRSGRSYSVHHILSACLLGPGTEREIQRSRWLLYLWWLCYKREQLNSGNLNVSSEQKCVQLCSGRRQHLCLLRLLTTQKILKQILQSKGSQLLFSETCRNIGNPENSLPTVIICRR